MSISLEYNSPKSWSSLSLNSTSLPSNIRLSRLSFSNINWEKYIKKNELLIYIKNIESFDGIEIYTNITEIYLYGNKIKDIMKNNL